MIERGKVNGQDATISYFTQNFKPCEPHEADFCEVWFDKPTEEGFLNIILNMRNQVAQH
jgi:hypothetical protein